jgi:hypothetical protein
MREYSITDTGLRLMLTYGRVRDLALRGVLKARRNEQGRLMVSAESVEAYRQQRTAFGAAA